MKKISREESAEYFSTRPFDLRIMFLVSEQGKAIKTKQVNFLDFVKNGLNNYHHMFNWFAIYDMIGADRS